MSAIEAILRLSEKKFSNPTGGHTSASNKTEEYTGTKKATSGVLKTISQEGKEGKEGRSNKYNPNGTEVVPGHKKTLLTMESMFTAPDTSGLRDIGEASFGKAPEISLKTVHGPDDRAQITDTATYPWRAIASLLITGSGQFPMDRHWLVYWTSYINDCWSCSLY